MTWYSSRHDPGGKMFQYPHIIYYLYILFKSALCLIIITVSGSSSSKLLSRLILLRSMLRISIPLKLNTTSPEPSLN